MNTGIEEIKSTETLVDREEPLKAILYSRIAPAKADDAASALTKQTGNCWQYARMRGYEVVAAFEDRASGIGDERPGLQEMLAFLRDRPDREPIAVVVDDVTRLARDIKTFMSLRLAIDNAGGIMRSPNFNFGDETAANFVKRVTDAVAGRETRMPDAEDTSSGVADFEEPFPELS